MTGSDTPTQRLEHFASLLQAPSPPLLECALAIAEDRYPNLEADDWLREFGSLAEKLARRVPSDASPMHRLRLLNHYFFDELGFHGDHKNFYDPENSYLNRVLERRTGLPITLSVLYMEFGAALGLRMSGLAFPRHFLVHLVLTAGDVIIDVFDQGKSLSMDELRDRLVAAGVTDVPIEAYLRDASTQEIVARMLRNLKNVYGKRHEWHALLSVQNRLVMLLPEAAEERRDRADTFMKLECPRGAVEDYVAYLSAVSHAEDEPEIRSRLAQARASANALN